METLRDTPVVRQVVADLLSPPLAGLLDAVKSTEVIKSLRLDTADSLLAAPMVGLVRKYVRMDSYAEFCVCVTRFPTVENTSILINGRLRRVGYIWEMLLAQRNRFMMLQVLMLRSPALLETRDGRRSQTPLSLALSTGNSNKIVAFLARLARTSRAVDVEQAHATDDSGNTPLTYAIASNQDIPVQHVLESYPQAIHQLTPPHSTSPNMTMLSLCAARGSCRAARVLLQRRVDVNEVPPGGLPALHVCVQYGLNYAEGTASNYVQFMHLLLSQEDIDFNAVSSVDTPREKWRGMHALHLCASHAKRRATYADMMVRQLLRCPGIDIDIKTANGSNTPLLMAMRNKSFTLALAFVQAGACLEHMNSRDKNAMDYICLAVQNHYLSEDLMDGVEPLEQRLVPLARAMVLALPGTCFSLLALHKSVKFVSRRPLLAQSYWRRSFHSLTRGGPKGINPEAAKGLAVQRCMFHCVLSMLLVMRRLRLTGRCRTTRARRGLPPGLPHELVLAVLSFVSEHDFSRAHSKSVKVFNVY